MVTTPKQKTTTKKTTKKMTKKTTTKKAVSLIKVGSTSEEFKTWAMTMESWRSSGDAKNSKAWAEAREFILDWADKIKSDQKKAANKAVRLAREAYEKAMAEANTNLEEEQKRVEREAESRRQASETRRYTEKAKKKAIEDNGKSAWDSWDQEERDEAIATIKKEWEEKNYNPLEDDAE